MAELTTLARPYAKALFETAQAADTLSAWSATLALLTAVVREPAVQSLLDSPERTARQQADTIIDICGDALDDKARNLVGLLAANRRLPLIPLIDEQFDALKALREQTVEVELVSAREISPEQQQALGNALSRKLDRQVNINLSVDQSLLGGILIRAGDTIIDGSIRGRLNKLAEALNS
ncbi:MAG: F0F1 ATP synthase subunit delta [Bacteroidales bacterium]|nr:F0F1 ATP synthase subunit delta [Bacteroidales bacterium]